MASPDPTHSQATIRRLCDKVDKAEQRLKVSLKKVKLMLPTSSQPSLQVTPDISVDSTAGAGVGEVAKTRIPSDVSTHTVWSRGGEAEGGGRWGSGLWAVMMNEGGC